MLDDVSGNNGNWFTHMNCMGVGSWFPLNCVGVRGKTNQDNISHLPIQCHCKVLQEATLARTLDIL